MCVIARPLDNRRIDALVTHRRALSGNTIVDKREFARPILKALGENQAVGILVDQNASPENGAFVNFFGVPACAFTGFAKLAARSGAAVIPGFALWSEREGRYVLRFDPPIEITGDETADTARIQRHLELVIRAAPGSVVVDSPAVAHTAARRAGIVLIVTVDAITPVVC